MPKRSSTELQDFCSEDLTTAFFATSPQGWLFAVSVVRLGFSADDRRSRCTAET